MNCSLSGLRTGISSFLWHAWQWARAHAKALARVTWTAFAAIALAVIVYQIARNWQEVRTYPWRLRLGNILLGFGIYSISIVLTAVCWASIMHRVSGVRSLWGHVRLFCLTNLARRLPTPLPYIGARTEAYAVQGVARRITLVAMTLEMTVTVVSAMMVAVFTLPFGPYSEVLTRFSPLTLLLLIAPVLLTIRPAWLFAIINFALARAKRPPLLIEVRTRDMLAWTGLFAAVWVNGGVLYYFLSTSIYPIPCDELLLMISIFAISGVAGWLGQILFFMPALAMRQLVIAYLLSLCVPLPVAVAVALWTRLCVLVFELLWAVLSLSLPLPQPGERPSKVSNRS